MKVLEKLLEAELFSKVEVGLNISILFIIGICAGFCLKTMSGMTMVLMTVACFVVFMCFLSLLMKRIYVMALYVTYDREKTEYMSSRWF